MQDSTIEVTFLEDHIDYMSLSSPHQNCSKCTDCLAASLIVTVMLHPQGCSSVWWCTSLSRHLQARHWDLWALRSEGCRRVGWNESCDGSLRRNVLFLLHHSYQVCWRVCEHNSWVWVYAKFVCFLNRVWPVYILVFCFIALHIYIFFTSF